MNKQLTAEERHQKHLENTRNWRANNPEKAAAYHKKWVKENPEKVAAITARYWQKKISAMQEGGTN